MISSKIALELVSHEGLVREAYKDSVGVWTWSIGVTTASGHKVWPRYVDNVQTYKKCFEIYEWLVRTKYLPKVQSVFAGHALSEAQLGAALSFHYNTGRIHLASWPKLWKQGKVAQAREAIMNWSSPPEIIPRRKKEQKLFFDGVWSSDGTVTEYQVKKPSYTPKWSSARKVDVKDIIDDLFD